MAVNGWRVADSDMHVMEPADLWQRYMDPAWAHAAPIGLSEMVARHARPREEPHDAAHGPGAAEPRRREGLDAPSRTTCSRRTRRAAGTRCRSSRPWTTKGLDMAVLFPSRGLFVLGLDSVRQIGQDGLEGDYAAAIARAYNDWLARLLLRGPDAAVRRRPARAARRRPRGRGSRRAVSRSSASGPCSCTPAASTGGRGTTPYYDPIWAECERHGMPVCFHGGGQTYLKPDYTLEVFDKLMMWHVVQPAARDPGHGREPHERRRAPEVPRVEGRAARGQLRMGALAACSGSTSTGSGSARWTRPTSRSRRRSTSARTAT